MFFVLKRSKRLHELYFLITKGVLEDFLSLTKLLKLNKTFASHFVDRNERLKCGSCFPAMLAKPPANQTRAAAIQNFKKRRGQ